MPVLAVDTVHRGEDDDDDNRNVEQDEDEVSGNLL